MTDIKPPLPKALLHGINDVQAMLSCSRSTVYLLINSGRLHAVKILGATRITDESLQKLIAAAPKASIVGNFQAPQPRKRNSRISSAA
jgi:hypothetical protein